jgi:hypothetical protein
MMTVLILAHYFYANECCHEQHCHPVPCSEVTSLGDGWRWRDKTFTKTMLRISPDGDCHVCISVTVPLCIYLPSRV